MDKINKLEEKSLKSQVQILLLKQCNEESDKRNKMLDENKFALTEKIEKLTGDLEGKGKQIQALRQAREEASRKLQGTEEQFKNANQQLKSEITTLEKEKKMCEESLEEAVSEMQSIKLRFTELKDDHSNTVEEKDKQISDLNIMIEKTCQERDQLAGW